jgi:hypothetical protein
MGVEQIETFWLEVGQAYQKVATNHDLKVTVERADKQALIYFGRYEDPSDEFVAIHVREVDTHVVETLVSP